MQAAMRRTIALATAGATVLVTAALVLVIELRVRPLYDPARVGLAMPTLEALLALLALLALATVVVLARSAPPASAAPAPPAPDLSAVSNVAVGSHGDRLPGRHLPRSNFCDGRVLPHPGPHRGSG